MEVLTGQFGQIKTPAQRIRESWAQSLQAELDVKRMTRKQFQHALEEAGHKVSHQAVAQWLTGVVSPSPVAQAYIAHVLQAPPHRLFPLPSVVGL